LRIGIIGAGHIGGTLARRLAALGHEVALANSRGPATLEALAAETGARAATAARAADGADLVVVTIPLRRVADLDPEIFKGRRPGAPIVDTMNYYPGRDGRIGEIEDGLAESRWVERRIGQPVVKAFNNIYFQHLLELGRPAGDPRRIALPVAGDDPGTKAKVMALVDELGFDAVDAGSLDDSWRQQPGTPCYTQDLGAEELRRALASASPERGPKWRA